VDKGELIVKLPKQVRVSTAYLIKMVGYWLINIHYITKEKGMFFPHLDMLNTLITNKSKQTDKMTDRPSIQIVDKNNNTYGNN